MFQIINSKKSKQVLANEICDYLKRMSYLYYLDKLGNDEIQDNKNVLEINLADDLSVELIHDFSYHEYYDPLKPKKKHVWLKSSTPLNALVKMGIHKFYISSFTITGFDEEHEKQIVNENSREDLVYNVSAFKEFNYYYPDYRDIRFTPKEIKYICDKVKDVFYKFIYYYAQGLTCDEIKATIENRLEEFDMEKLEEKYSDEEYSTPGLR